MIPGCVFEEAVTGDSVGIQLNVDLPGRCGRLLDTGDVDSSLSQFLQSLFSQLIGSHCTDHTYRLTVTSESFETAGEVGGGSAKAGASGKHVPEHFTQTKDRRLNWSERIIHRDEPGKLGRGPAVPLSASEQMSLGGTGHRIWQLHRNDAIFNLTGKSLLSDRS